MTDGTLRDWLRQADAMGELREIKGADWDLEIGALSALNVKRKDAPALLFDNIKEYPGGYRVLTCSTSSRGLLALALNIPSGDTDRELVETLIETIPKWEESINEFPPLITDSGPVLENVHSGDDVDVFEFPVPKWHSLDKGRYIGTADAVITQDPDTGEVNLGTYRVMVHNKNTVGLFITPGKHGRIHYEKYHARGKPCPVAISIGHHPLIFRISGTRIAKGTEYNFIGAIRREPVKVIKEEITGLPIPYDSEIVLAGWCPPNMKMDEGPFGEWTGYYASKQAPAPIVKLERIYHRNSPIILGAPPSRPPHDSAYYRMIMGSALLFNDLQKNGIPEVKGVWLSEAGLELLIVISLRQRYPGHAKQAALFVTQNRLSASLGRHVIVVDEDIDPSNMNDVIWAFCTRCDPKRDIEIIDRMWSSSLDPMSSPPTQVHFGSRTIIDACKPYEWIDEFPNEVRVSPELERRVIDKWGHITGFS